MVSVSNNMEITMVLAPDNICIIHAKMNLMVH